jgi:hypothetical protein
MIFSFCELQEMNRKQSNYLVFKKPVTCPIYSQPGHKNGCGSDQINQFICRTSFCHTTSQTILLFLSTRWCRCPDDLEVLASGEAGLYSFKEIGNVMSESRSWETVSNFFKAVSRGFPRNWGLPEYRSQPHDDLVWLNTPSRDDLCAPRLPSGFEILDQILS